MTPSLPWPCQSLIGLPPEVRERINSLAYSLSGFDYKFAGWRTDISLGNLPDIGVLEALWQEANKLFPLFHAFLSEHDPQFSRWCVVLTFCEQLLVVQAAKGGHEPALTLYRMLQAEAWRRPQLLKAALPFLEGNAALQCAETYLGHQQWVNYTDQFLGDVQSSRPELYEQLQAGPYSRNQHRQLATPSLRDFAYDPKLSLPGHVRSRLFKAEPEEILALLADPPVNPMSYWFDPHWEDFLRYPWPEAGAEICQLLELLLLCGYGEWMVAQTQSLPPRVWILWLLSGEPVLVNAACKAFGAPELDCLLEGLRKRRTTLVDHTSPADFGVAHPHFLAALADAIERYSLLADSLDQLLNPIAFFRGFEKAEPGRLSAFFTHCSEQLPILAYYEQSWLDLPPPVYLQPIDAEGRAEWYGSMPPYFHHPRGPIYTRCHLYRTRMLGEAWAIVKGSDPTKLQALWARQKKNVVYLQSGNAEGFRNDSRRMVQAILKKGRRTDVLAQLV
ncbi:hypothetical protein [Chitinivorax sp. B]|uniref:hypothetical protein n=1 Tax=Chitinivorax sp. B TaxID=2502235 RepID=UPI0010F45A93|nr:hypothetical protein [Chitinivorax sp. B]